MKFVYKIYSGFDGFTPHRIPERLTAGGLLVLGWKIYLDVVERGREVWVYFYGPHRFSPGVYGKGFVHRVDRKSGYVFLRLREHSVQRPLTDPELSNRIGQVVAKRYRQVFVLPEELEPRPECTISLSAESCAARLCLSCPTWKSLPVLDSDDFHWPPRLSDEFEDFTSAYWVIPSRCYLMSGGREVTKTVRQTSEIFYRFKVGETALVFPLASGIYEALSRKKVEDFDCIVPIPLSPDKANTGEAHRTLLLANEVSDRMGVPVDPLLSLRVPISKRYLQSLGVSTNMFERRYLENLEVGAAQYGASNVLLLDDVCTRGSTLSMALAKLKERFPKIRVFAATAGLMITKAVVANEKRLTEVAR